MLARLPALLHVCRPACLPPSLSLPSPPLSANLNSDLARRFTVQLDRAEEGLRVTNASLAVAAAVANEGRGGEGRGGGVLPGRLSQPTSSAAPRLDSQDVLSSQPGRHSNGASFDGSRLVYWLNLCGGAAASHAAIAGISLVTPAKKTDWFFTPAHRSSKRAVPSKPRSCRRRTRTDADAQLVCNGGRRRCIKRWNIRD